MRRRGFVDLQLNGFLGVDFSSPDLDYEGILRATQDLARIGTAGYCATIITSRIELYRRNLPLLARAMAEPALRGRILGIHLEGPYLSPVDGARGAHNLDLLRRPDPGEFERLQEWAGGNIRILTLAPELDGALDLIRHVRSRHRTVVSLGHHAAQGETLRRAVEAGASMCTHLGNGCPETIHRHRNVLFAQLAEDGLTAGIITDGHHLPEDFLRVVFRCKGPGRVFVVSDLTSIGGCPPGIYTNLGNEVRLTPDGRIQNLHTPYLVGSACDLARCMRHLRSLEFLSEEELWDAGRNTPLRMLGLDPASFDDGELAAFEW